jgi:hypothetical protein
VEVAPLRAALLEKDQEISQLRGAIRLLLSDQAVRELVGAARDEPQPVRTAACRRGNRTVGDVEAVSNTAMLHMM